MHFVYKIWCEWDIGHENLVWAYEESARRFAREYFEQDEAFDETLEELEEQGMVSFERMEVLP